MDWTRKQEIKLINTLQDQYVDELIEKINHPHTRMLKFLNFTSPTGTGKTIMMCKLINKLSSCFFIVTSLSRGRLYKQIEDTMHMHCTNSNLRIYGVSSYKKNSILQDDDIIEDIKSYFKENPNGEFFWLRDEGHIASNNWSRLLEDKCSKIINFSATNKEEVGVVCNFTNTMMLRTVNQQCGTIDDALDQIIKIKQWHKKVPNYNPCALVRLTSSKNQAKIIEACESRNLKWVTLIENDEDIQKLCEDDNDIDVIINLQKIVEGIDIRRAHVIWLENQPGNPATTIQQIGRCRRNALLWREDIDIFKPSNKNLLAHTRECYVYYNVVGMKIDKNEYGELTQAFCPYISIEKIKPYTTIHVDKGRMPNGLYVSELENQTGDFRVMIDKETGFNCISKTLPTYKEESVEVWDYKIQEAVDLLVFLKSRSIEYQQRLKKNLEMVTVNYEDVDFQRVFHSKFGPVIVPVGGEFVNELHILKDNGRIEVISLYQTINEDGDFEASVNEINEMYNADDFMSYVKLQLLSRYHAFAYHYKAANIRLRVSKTKTIECSPYIVHYYLSNGTFPLFFMGYNKRDTMDKDLPWPNSFIPYFLTTNNRLLSLVSQDTFSFHHNGKKTVWSPDIAVLTKIRAHSKFNEFLIKQYQNIIDGVKPQLFSNRSDYKWNGRLGSCLGFCVEYYAKGLIWGLWDANSKEQTKNVRKCIERYHEQMRQTFGNIRYLPGISYKTLESHPSFVDDVVKYGLRTATFIRENCNIEETMIINPSIQTKNLSALIDIMDRHTILDIKCTNSIDETMIKQVLAYYFLSSLRNDVAIDTLIIYDAVSDRNIKISVPIQPLQAKMNDKETEKWSVINSFKYKAATDKSPFNNPLSYFGERGVIGSRANEALWKMSTALVNEGPIVFKRKAIEERIMRYSWETLWKTSNNVPSKSIRKAVEKEFETPYHALVKAEKGQLSNYPSSITYELNNLVSKIIMKETFNMAFININEIDDTQLAILSFMYEVLNGIKPKATVDVITDINDHLMDYDKILYLLIRREFPLIRESMIFAPGNVKSCIWSPDLFAELKEQFIRE